MLTGHLLSDKCWIEQLKLISLNAKLYSQMPTPFFRTSSVFLTRNLIEFLDIYCNEEILKIPTTTKTNYNSILMCSDEKINEKNKYTRSLMAQEVQAKKTLHRLITRK